MMQHHVTAAACHVQMKKSCKVGFVVLSRVSKLTTSTSAVKDCTLLLCMNMERVADMLSVC